MCVFCLYIFITFKYGPQKNSVSELVKLEKIRIAYYKLLEIPIKFHD